MSFFGGSERIRTSGAIADTPVFKTGALNHYATLPCFIFLPFSKYFFNLKVNGGGGDSITNRSPPAQVVATSTRS